MGKIDSIEHDIRRRASAIAGACWDDRGEATRRLPLAEQLRVVAGTAALGSDGDLTIEDRRALWVLSDII